MSEKHAFRITDDSERPKCRICHRDERFLSMGSMPQSAGESSVICRECWASYDVVKGFPVWPKELAQ